MSPSRKPASTKSTGAVIDCAVIIKRVLEREVLSAVDEIVRETFVARASIVSATDPTFSTLFAI